MNLAGQGARRQPGRAVPKLDDGGYIMVVLLIGIAVSAVWMSAMLPAWRQQAMRQKEMELIFRGEEYARAIALYWRKNNQTLPSSIDVLVSQRYLRKKYLDPITNKEFITVGGASAGFGGGPGGGPSLQGAGGRGPGPGAGPSPAQLGGRAGISGVRSTSTATSIITYRGQTTYAQFPFDYVMALQRMGSAIPSGAPQPVESGRGAGGRRGGAPARGGAAAPERIQVPRDVPAPGRGAAPGRGR